MSAESALQIVVVLLPMTWAALLFAYRSALRRLWREPTLSCPVLIIESDDWGPGPQEHVAALERIISLLGRHRDATGRPAVMTIGAILAVPDNVAIRHDGFRRYDRRTLLEPAFEAMREALLRGRDRGVLALQLHGLEHLFPATLMRAATEDGPVRRWIASSDGCETEALPSAVQSRWTDASVLPSQALSSDVIDAAVAEEVRLFRECFSEQPVVAVPPTFVWNAEVERAWVDNGIEVVVTPGRRLTMRDAQGRPGGVDRAVLNAERSESGVTYLVRDVYFEPGLGHTAERTLADIDRRFQLGRPALIETHRFNFIAETTGRDRYLAELDRLLRLALQRWPGLRFLSAVELSRQLALNERGLVDRRIVARFLIWIRRVAAIDRLRKLGWMTGLALPVSLLYFAARLAVSNEAGASNSRV